MWWWVLISPGVTRQPAASSTDEAAGTGSADEPTPLIRPPVIATHPPGSSRREPSQVATSFAFRTRRSQATMSGIGVSQRGAGRHGRPENRDHVVQQYR